MQKVLIADDDSTSLSILKRIVDACGMVPILSTDGARAFQVLQDNPDFSLLITDISMPNMDGRSLIRVVRAHEKLKDIPIFVLSGVVLPSEINALLQLGASKFLPKPINPSDVKDYLVKLSHQQQVRDRVPTGLSLA